MNTRLISLLFVTTLLFSANPALSDPTDGSLDHRNQPAEEGTIPNASSSFSYEVQAILAAADAAPGDRFGYRVAIDGDTIVASSLFHDDAIPESGSAYVFVRSGATWTPQAQLVAADPGSGDRFGSAVAISGDTVLVGAAEGGFGSGGAGKAYVFVRAGSSWSQQAVLTASDGKAYDYFGASASVSGDTAVVGAYGHGEGGAAYVFTRSGTVWNEQAKLVPFGSGYDAFGRSVATTGDVIVVAAPWSDGNHGDSGSAYVFDRGAGTWSDVAVLEASDAAPNAYFGSSVAMSSGKILIGAPGTDGYSGSAYVFTKDGDAWAEEAVLGASDAGSGSYFGASVAFSGQTALIGAGERFGPGAGSGAAYVYREATEWIEEAILTAADAAADDKFGSSVAISGETLVVNRPQFHPDPGYVVVFIAVEEPPGLACTIAGTPHDDVLLGTAGDDVICGHAGADTISGLGGNDILIGGPGNDVLRGNLGSDELFGGAGADLLFGGPGSDLLAGGGDADRLWGGPGDDELHGEDGSDDLIGDSGDDQLWGGPGGDSLEGRDGNDTLLGGPGADLLSGNQGDDTLFGQADEDSLIGGPGSDLLAGGGGADLIRGGTGDDHLHGDEGLDRLIGGNGNDSLWGGPGNDWIEGRRGDDTLRGGAGNDLLAGNHGDDTIAGGSGDDDLFGGPGTDKCAGGSGADRLVSCE